MTVTTKEWNRVQNYWNRKLDETQNIWHLEQNVNICIEIH